MPVGSSPVQPLAAAAVLPNLKAAFKLERLGLPVARAGRAGLFKLPMDFWHKPTASECDLKCRIVTLFGLRRDVISSAESRLTSCL